LRTRRSLGRRWRRFLTGRWRFRPSGNDKARNVTGRAIIHPPNPYASVSVDDQCPSTISVRR